MNHAEFISYAQCGHLDAMGKPFSAWLVARYHDDGRAIRDADGRQVFETQAEWLTRHGAPSTQPATPAQQTLF